MGISPADETMDSYLLALCPVLAIRSIYQCGETKIEFTVGFGDWQASLTGESSLEASLYAGQPNSRISTNQLYLRFTVAVLGVYEIPQGNSHYILYVGSLIVLLSTLNQASVLPPAKQPCIA